MGTLTKNTVDQVILTASASVSITTVSSNTNDELVEDIHEETMSDGSEDIPVFNNMPENGCSPISESLEHTKDHCSESEEDTENKINRSKRHRYVLSSDSESEGPQSNKQLPISSQEVTDKRTDKNVFNSLQSDSEEEINVTGKKSLENRKMNNEPAKSEVSNKRRIICPVDSDLDDESNDMDNKQNTAKKNIDSSSSDDGSDDQISEAPSEREDRPMKHFKSSFKNLIDEDSSEDEARPTTPVDVAEETSFTNKKKNVKKSVKKMTGKEAKLQRHEIASESQRMLRETSVSLPYHKPKPRTLKEFLQKRTCIAAPLPSEFHLLPASLAIKMSKERLITISKKLKERQKEMEEFYKSESESEPESENTNTRNDSPLPKDQAETPTQQLSTPTPDLKINTEEEKTETVENNDKPSPIKILSDEMLRTGNKIDVSNINFPVVNQTEYLHKNTILENATRNLFDDFSKCDDSLTEQSNIQNVTEASSEIETNITEENNLTSTDENVSKNLVNVNNLNGECSSNSSENFIDGLFSSQERLENNETIATSSEQCNVETNEIENVLKQSLENDTEFNLNSEPTTNLTNKENRIDDKQASRDKNEDLEFSDVTDKWDNGKCFDEILDSDNEETEITLADDKQNKVSVFANITPKLTGESDRIIVLEEDTERRSRVNTLMNRFIMHSTKDRSAKKKVELGIITTENGCLHEDTILLSLESPNTDEDARKLVEKPGEKLTKLKKTLKQQMLQKRLEEWTKEDEELEALKKENYEEIAFEDELTNKNKEETILDDNEIEEVDDEEEEEDEGEEEDEEEDEEVEEFEEKKPKATSAFFDDEAEVDEDVDDEMDENVETDADDEVSDGCEEQEEDNGNDLETNDTRKTKNKSKKLKRIKVGFADDSSEDESELFQTLSDSNLDSTQKKSEKLDLSSDVEKEIPAHQPKKNLERTPYSKKINNSASDFSFVSPVLHLTALQNMPSANKFLQDYPPEPALLLDSQPSPLRGEKDIGIVQKKLFTEPDIVNTQENIVALEDLCSGNFTNTVDGITNEASQSQKENPFLDSQWFTATAKDQNADDSLTKQLRLSREPSLISNLENSVAQVDESSQDFKLTWSDDSNSSFKQNETEPTKSVNTVEQYQIVSTSEDEENKEVTIKKPKVPIKKKKLNFSDEESADENASADDIESDKEENFNSAEEDEEVVIDYDSEENEMVVSKNKLKGSDFFEAEAELSESEWGSADEDERDLDQLEWEDGDNENIDERKVQQNLEKIHLRRLLDDDKKEVRMLQELLLQDGELHSDGAKRQRQFRWKNLNDEDGDETGPKNDEDGTNYEEDEDNEEEWRRQRHEREKFLREFKEKHGEQCNLSEDEFKSQDLGLQHSVIQKTVNNVQFRKSFGTTIVTKTASVQIAQTVSKPTEPTTPDAKNPYGKVKQRGSFLARGETELARLAAVVRSSDLIVGGAKNSRNFVFASVNKEDEIVNDDATIDSTPKTSSKRKALAELTSTPAMLKKLKQSDKSAKTDPRNSRVKKMFSLLK